jgi:hypothetical protein
MGNFQKYWSQNVGQDLIVFDFFVGGISCGRKRCVREINVSRAWDPVHAGDKALTREIPAKRGRVNRYGRVFTFWVPCYGVRYYFCIKTMFSSSLSLVVGRMIHVLFMLFVFVCVYLVAFFFVLCTLCCQFLLIVTSVLPLRLFIISNINDTIGSGTVFPSGAPEFLILNLKCSVNYLVKYCFFLFFRPLCCLSSIDWLSLITPLVSLNISNYYFMLHIWFQQIDDLFTLVLKEYHLYL